LFPRSSALVPHNFRAVPCSELRSTTTGVLYHSLFCSVQLARLSFCLQKFWRVSRSFPTVRRRLGAASPLLISLVTKRITDLSVSLTEVRQTDVILEIIHEQLPLPVPCYDLLPVTELTLGPPCGETSGTPSSLELTGGLR